LLIIPSSWGSQLDGEKISPPYRINFFSGAVAREEVEDFCEGSFSHTHPLLSLLLCFILFILPASFLSKIQKN
jgi:hypothetical protein